MGGDSVLVIGFCLVGGKINLNAVVSNNTHKIYSKCVLIGNLLMFLNDFLNDLNS